MRLIPKQVPEAVGDVQVTPELQSYWDGIRWRLLLGFIVYPAVVVAQYLAVVLAFGAPKVFAAQAVLVPAVVLPAPICLLLLRRNGFRYPSQWEETARIYAIVQLFAVGIASFIDVLLAGPDKSLAFDESGAPGLFGALFGMYMVVAYKTVRTASRRPRPQSLTSNWADSSVSVELFSATSATLRIVVTLDTDAIRWTQARYRDIPLIQTLPLRAITDVEPMHIPESLNGQPWFAGRSGSLSQQPFVLRLHTSQPAVCLRTQTPMGDVLVPTPNPFATAERIRRRIEQADSAGTVGDSGASYQSRDT